MAIAGHRRGLNKDTAALGSGSSVDPNLKTTKETKYNFAVGFLPETMAVKAVSYKLEPCRAMDKPGVECSYKKYMERNK